MCSSEDAVAVTSMSKELKRGFVMRYKKRLFGSNWRDGILTLHEDSTVAWRPGDSASRPVEVGARLSDAPEMIAAGQFASAVPGGIPDFPDGASIKQSIAVGARGRKTILWDAIQLYRDFNVVYDVILFHYKYLQGHTKPR